MPPVPLLDVMRATILTETADSFDTFTSEQNLESGRLNFVDS
jgi:hypothetical protein